MPQLVAQHKLATFADIPRELQEAILLMAAVAQAAAARPSSSAKTAVPTAAAGLASLCDIGHTLAAIALALPSMAPDLRFIMYTISSACSIDECCRRGDLALLQWWYRLELEPSSPQNGKLHSHAPRHHRRRRPTPIQYSQQAMTLATSGNHVHVLDWWHSNASSWVMKFEKRLLDGAARHGHLEAIQWWFQNKFASPYHPAWDYRAQGVLREAVQNGRWAIVEWWIETGMIVEPLGRIVVDCIKAHPSMLEPTLEWLQESGYGEQVFGSESDRVAFFKLVSANARAASRVFPGVICATGEVTTEKLFRQ